MKLLILFIIGLNLAFAQTQKKVTLIERQSSASCSSCAAAHKTFQPFAESLDDNAIIITYPRHDNSHYDPMGIFANEIVKTRMADYYNNNSFPTAVVNGKKEGYLLNILDLEPEDSDSEIIINSDNSLNGTDLSLNTDLEIVGDNPNLQNPNTRLFAVIKEDYVSYDQSPGSNGETEFYDIIRYMFDNANGFEITWNDNNATVNLNQNLDLSEVNINNLKIVVFVQNLLDGTVYQAQSFDVNLSTNINNYSDKISIFPNPSYQNIKISDLSNGDKVLIFNSLGDKVIDTLYNGNINIESLTSGQYFIILESNEIVKFVKN
ncbi:Omp28-related outer membrane protein [Candidatus Kapabacteria bacterium]|nr:Omp28-related outer membrane protein [Candidatus Kapabacteria bacterium]